MARIQLKLKKTKSKGKHAGVYYQINHTGNKRFISSGIKIISRDWTVKENKIISLQNPMLIHNLQHQVDIDLYHLELIIKSLEKNNKEFNIDEIPAAVKRIKATKIYRDLIREEIELLDNNKKFGTAINYRRALNSFEKYLIEANFSSEGITSSLVESYGDYLLEKGLCRNTLSFYMRILRAVYNKGVESGIFKQTYPFKKVYTGTDKTKKRAVSECIISSLKKLEIIEPSLSLARDIFLFSFYTRGMSFIDVANLRRSDLNDGFIRYIRRKTGQPLSIKIEPCIKEIIDRYSGNTSESNFVFPILEGENDKERYRNYKSKLRQYNQRLNQLSAILGNPCKLSSYTSRHSWATIARNHNIPLSVISAGMGHSSENVTLIYLKSIDNNIIDDANRTLLEQI